MEQYLDKYMPLQVQSMIDETMVHALNKKQSLLKALNEHEKAKFKSLEENLKL